MGFVGVLQGCADEIAYMIVRERIEDVFAVSAALHDALLVEDAELLRQGGELGLAGERELRYAVLAGVELVEEPQAREVPCRAKQGRGALEGLVADDQGRVLGVAVWATGLVHVRSFDRAT
jgi:hypothetical protein